MRYIKIALVVCLIAVCSSVSAQKERRYIRESFTQYNDSDFVGAQESSARAMAENPNSFEAKYNYAGSLFQQQKVDEAQQLYEEMAATETDKARLAQLYHNIGDCQYLKQEFDKSVESFKKSLRADPQDDRTRYNLVAAKKMLQNPPPQQQQQ
ncbi:MAG: tetratricopeptide repeat protein, partial [Bacteroidales bacterium]|nr:tetratricopeptide repeat protein [Bacteroidales bacterium]